MTATAVLLKSVAEGIFPVNWSSFLPDVLVGVITGAIIGFALDLVARRRFSREEARDSRVSWDRLRVSLRDSFARPIGGSVSEWMNVADGKRILDGVKAYPIHEWARNTGDPILHALARLESNLVGLNDCVAHLQGLIGPMLRSSRPASVPQVRLMELHRDAESLVRAMILGIDLNSTGIKPESFGLSGAQVENWLRGVVADTEVDYAVNAYRIMLQLCTTDHQIVQSSFT